MKLILFPLANNKTPRLIQLIPKFGANCEIECDGTVTFALFLARIDKLDGVLCGT